MTDEFQLQQPDETRLLESEEMLTTGEVAKIFGVSSNTVVNWVKTGKIRGRKTPGGHYRVPRSAVREYGTAKFGQGNSDPAIADVI